VSELVRIASRCAGRVEVHVLVYTPEPPVPEWTRAGWLRRLTTIPDGHVVNDPGGREAARFGAETSGHVVFYTPDGSLRFRGWITVARGHEGDNRGKETVLSPIAGSRPSTSQHPVYGCPLH
jgi:hypothetical protein